MKETIWKTQMQMKMEDNIKIDNQEVGWGGLGLD